MIIAKNRRRSLENITVSRTNKNKTLVRTAVLLTTKCPKNETTNSSTVAVYLFFLFFSILFLITGDLERDEAKHNATRCWKSHVTADTFVRAPFDTAFTRGRAIMRFTTAALRPGLLKSVSCSFFAPVFFFFFCCFCFLIVFPKAL